MTMLTGASVVSVSRNANIGAASSPSAQCFSVPHFKIRPSGFAPGAGEAGPAGADVAPACPLGGLTNLVSASALTRDLLLEEKTGSKLAGERFKETPLVVNDRRMLVVIL